MKVTIDMTSCMEVIGCGLMMGLGWLLGIDVEAELHFHSKMTKYWVSMVVATLTAFWQLSVKLAGS